MSRYLLDATLAPIGNVSLPTANALAPLANNDFLTACFEASLITADSPIVSAITTKSGAKSNTKSPVCLIHSPADSRLFKSFSNVLLIYSSRASALSAALSLKVLLYVSADPSVVA